MAPRHENLPLTAIRGLAACWVVLLHVHPALLPEVPAAISSVLSIGYVAVDIFFVLSGFILAALYAGLPIRAAPEFWLRRACRVYPLHVAIMTALALAALTTTALHINRTNHSWPTFPIVLALLHPYVRGAISWNAPSWSVGIELICYALFPFAAWPLRRLRTAELAALAALFAAFEGLVLIRCGGAVEGRAALLRGLAGFHLGMILAVLAPRLAPGGAPALAWLGALGVGAGLVLVSPVVVVLAACVLIAALTKERGRVARVLSARWMVWVGQVSFSIYLLHGPLLALLQRLELPVGPPGRALVLVAILLPLSALTWRFVEQPGRRLPALLLGPPSGRFRGSGWRPVPIPPPGRQA